VNRDSAFIISNSVYVIKENDMILDVQCHCFVFYAKYVLEEIKKQVQKTGEKKAKQAVLVQDTDDEY
jgi:hypothetical protein